MMGEPDYSGFGYRLFSGLLGVVLLGTVGNWVVDSGVNDAGSVALARSVQPLLSLPVERIVPAHDQVVTDGARARLREALAWWSGD